MELHMKVASIFFNGLLFLNFVICEKPLNGQEELKWVCNCAANPLSVPNSLNTYDCSTSCHCVPGKIGVADGVRWSCSCAPLATQVTENIHRSSCFASCNCSFGSRGTSAYQKQITSKDIIVILLACVVFISICLVVSIAFHFYRKEKPYLQRRIYSSARDTSSNSSANLISYRSASFLRFQHKTDSLNPLTEFFRRITFIFKGDKQIIHGSTIQFSFSELEQATDRFSSANLIGQGVSSNVFRGKLFDGRIVAIKKLKLKVFSEEEADSVFLTEIELISRLNHCHVVPILGYCTEYQSRNYERLLVFEYMPNGNLRECLDAKHGKEPLSWATRVRIALGAARGLEYLHEASAPRILHRDIKSTNILLDENYKPKITDLGMAKCLMAEDYPSCSSSPAQMLGTFGYFAPEYAIVGKASLKSDVFSYGVVILELITGRPPIQKSSKGDESLVIWGTPRLNNSRLVVAELPDPLLKGNFPEEEMQIMAHLARECLQWDPESRPTMSEIVQILTSIAPEKNQRRNFHENFHRGLSWRSIRGVSASDKPPYCSNISSEEEDNSGRSQDESSLFEQNGRLSERVHVNQGRRIKEFVLSAEYMQELAFLASAIQSRRCSEEVDLTEPRFESFI